MKKFNGDLMKWAFWDSSSSSIDANPALSGIDKINYLISLLESTVTGAIAGLTPTNANYEEAVATLKKRFGNPQLIINRHSTWRHYCMCLVYHPIMTSEASGSYTIQWKLIFED